MKLIKNTLLSALSLALILFCVAVNHAFAAQEDINLEDDTPEIEFTFDAPTEREDGSELRPEEIAGYRLYLTHGNETVVHEVDSSPWYVTVNEPGIYTAQISTVDSDGIEGQKSPPISTAVTLKRSEPAAPSLPAGPGWHCSINCKFELIQ